MSLCSLGSNIGYAKKISTQINTVLYDFINIRAYEKNWKQYSDIT